MIVPPDKKDIVYVKHMGRTSEILIEDQVRMQEKFKLMATKKKNRKIKLMAIKEIFSRGSLPKRI